MGFGDDWTAAELEKALSGRRIVSADVYTDARREGRDDAYEVIGWLALTLDDGTEIELLPVWSSDEPYIGAERGRRIRDIFGVAPNTETKREA